MKTHPLTAHAKSVLAQLLLGPVPSQEINPGVIARFMRESLVEVVDLPSPYKSHFGVDIDHIRILPAGIKAMEATT